MFGFGKKNTVGMMDVYVCTQGKERKLRHVPVDFVPGITQFMMRFDFMSSLSISLASECAPVFMSAADGKTPARTAPTALFGAGKISPATFESMVKLQKYHDLLLWAEDYYIPTHIFDELEESISALYRVAIPSEAAAVA